MDGWIDGWIVRCMDGWMDEGSRYKSIKYIL